ncbi:MAG: hypothetical protein SVO01_00280 [Thermotogota bacterium]|nr:hypothetical protein [Thermotogota bacterium]
MELCPFPKFRALDSNGDPLSGGKLYTYEPGTTTEKTSYSDVGASSANANPVVLDSAGEANVYLVGKYKLVLKDADDVTQWTVDNVQAGDEDFVDAGYYVNANETDQGAAGNGYSVYDIMEDVGTTKKATLIFRHTGSGATTTYTYTTSDTITSNFDIIIQNGAILSDGGGSATLTISGHLKAGLYKIFDWTGSGSINFTAGAVERIYPQWGGALGDGSNDDYAAIQLMLDSVPEGGEFFFPDASSFYRITDELTVEKSIHINGSGFNNKASAVGELTGACIRQETATKDCLVIGVGVDPHDDEIDGAITENISVGGASGTGSALVLNHYDRGTVRNVYVAGAGEYGIKIKNYCILTRFTDVRVAGNKTAHGGYGTPTHGWYLNQYTTSNFYHCGVSAVTSSPGIGWYIASGNCLFSGIESEGNTIGFHFADEASGNTFLNVYQEANGTSVTYGTLTYKTNFHLKTYEATMAFDENVGSTISINQIDSEPRLLFSNICQFYAEGTAPLDSPASLHAMRSTSYDDVTANTFDNIPFVAESASNNDKVTLFGLQNKQASSNNRTKFGVSGSSGEGRLYIQSRKYNIGTVSAILLNPGGSAAADGGVHIGTSSPTTSAALEVTSTVGAFIPPRLTTTQRDALTPTNGMLIYNTTTGTMQGYTSGSWSDL